ncbi:FecR family protein [Paraglaciecola sp.]|uniref:FecR family protein n=1 Tax=Paraglaciecola sp. TaxID=1920173 RepID=UPI003EF39C81
MKNVLNFPSNAPFDQKQIEQEAIEWLVKLDGDSEATEGDLLALKEWMGRSPEHAKEIKSLNEFNSELLVLTELNIPLVKPISKDNSSLSRWGWAAAASMVGFVFLLQQTLFPMWFTGEQFDNSNGYYASAIGKHTSIPLPDGSIVVLNTNSRIKVEYTQDHRNIYLIQGEAHFDVAKNKNKPFRVHAGKGRVEAVGTAFTVYLRKEDVEVLVTEGKVELAELKTTETASTLSGDGLISQNENKEPALYIAIPVEQFGRLEAGEGATIYVSQSNEVKRELPSVKVEVMDDKQRKRRDTWREGFVLFTGDTLEDVITEISRYSPVEIEIIDPALKKIRIGGQFKIGDLDGLFDTLEFSFGLNITKLENKRIEISAAQMENIRH